MKKYLLFLTIILLFCIKNFAATVDSLDVPSAVMRKSYKAAIVKDKPAVHSLLASFSQPNLFHFLTKQRHCKSGGIRFKRCKLK